MKYRRSKEHIEALKIVKESKRFLSIKRDRPSLWAAKRAVLKANPDHCTEVQILYPDGLLEYHPRDTGFPRNLWSKSAYTMSNFTDSLALLERTYDLIGYL